jgi:N-acetylneuraminate synthase|tara:strand:- start:8734 stop:9594 length:861 start_codon:yes stop_codon:yes gene_type:complete
MKLFNPYKNKSNLPFFIAEIGINHNGDLATAKQLIDMAADAGCHAVKFQKRDIDTVYTQEYLAGERESPWGTTQRDQKEGLEFDKQDYDIINDYCDIKGILWSASAWDIESQKFLQQYNLSFNKVASAMLTHHELLEVVASEKRHAFISTGMATFEDIDKAVTIFRDSSCPFTLFHCVSTYPCAEEDCNLRVMANLQRRYGCPVGYSGHESDTFPSVLATANGAAAIERHITLDKDMYGSDQSASINGEELSHLIEQISRVKSIMGNGEKTFSDAEKTVADKLRYF